MRAGPRGPPFCVPFRPVQQVVKQLDRFDAGVARGEAALATLFLISMILVASIQAVCRNLAGMEIEWATSSLEYLTWVDPFLQKGTLWLAFLGASLATREGRHIGIDLLPRLAPKKTKLLMRAVAALGSSAVAFFLARAFWAAVLVNADEAPPDMEVWVDMSTRAHVCDATLAQVTDAQLEAPPIFCAIRGFLGSLGVPVSTGQSAMQLIVPVMFFVMSVRLFANSVGAAIKLATGQVDDEPEPPSPELAHLKTSRSSDDPQDESGSPGDDAPAAHDDADDDVDDADDDEPDPENDSASDEEAADDEAEETDDDEKEGE